MLLHIGPLARFVTEEDYLGSVTGHLNDMNAVLELHRASEVIIRSDETVLKKINAWSRPFLKQKGESDQVYSGSLKSRIRKEVSLFFFPFFAMLEF